MTPRSPAPDAARIRRCPRFRRGGRIGTALLALTLATVLDSGAVDAQATGVVDIRDRRGHALVRNPSEHPLQVEVALWESNETGDQVELTARARGGVWPTHFELPPRQTQTVRLLLEEDAYGAGQQLRLEVRLTPAPPPADGTAGAGGARGRILLATRILAKVRIH